MRVLKRSIALLCTVQVVACMEPRDGGMGGSAVGSWSSYGGGHEGQQYSPADQIQIGNVHNLERAWEYRTGDIGAGRTTKGTMFEATPVLDERTLYFCTPFNRVIALDAETGRERWSYDPRIDLELAYALACRGVALWKDGAHSEQRPQRRVFYGTSDGRLIALDAETGGLAAAFGDGGMVELAEGLGHVYAGEVTLSSPPLVVGDLVVVGSAIADGQRANPPGGVVRAYDARTGELRWAWDPVAVGTPPLPAPTPGANSSDHGRWAIPGTADGPEPWIVPAGRVDPSQRFHRATPNSWAVASADVDRDLIFLPMGAPTPDYFGGDRPEEQRYSNAVVALRASTGELVWSFQTVRHDLWDYDVAAQPTLLELRTPEGKVPGLVQATKMGHLFVLDRVTGAPLLPIEERVVSTAAVVDERPSPIQPFPLHPAPLRPTHLGPEDAWGLTPWDRSRCRKRIEGLRYDGIFTPPTLEGSIQFPSGAGGTNWGGVALDPERRILVLNMVHIAQEIRLIPRSKFRRLSGANPYLFMPMHGTPYGIQREFLMSPLGIPCNPPPWGEIVGMDIDAGEVRWRQPFGEPVSWLPLTRLFGLGGANMGGPIITAGGIVFIAATTDAYLHAFDVETGEELWRDRLPASGHATPMTYRIPGSARQFVVVAAGGHSHIIGSKLGDSLVAYRLP